MCGLYLRTVVKIPYDLINTCLHLASLAPLLFPAPVFWAFVFSPYENVSRPSSLFLNALSPMMKEKIGDIYNAAGYWVQGWDMKSHLFTSAFFLLSTAFISIMCCLRLSFSWPCRDTISSFTILKKLVTDYNTMSTSNMLKAHDGGAVAWQWKCHTVHWGLKTITKDLKNKTKHNYGTMSEDSDDKRDIHKSMLQRFVSQLQQQAADSKG